MVFALHILSSVAKILQNPVPIPSGFTEVYWILLCSKFYWEYSVIQCYTVLYKGLFLLRWKSTRELSICWHTSWRITEELRTTAPLTHKLVLIHRLIGGQFHTKITIAHDSTRRSHSLRVSLGNDLLGIHMCRVCLAQKNICKQISVVTTCSV